MHIQKVFHIPIQTQILKNKMARCSNVMQALRDEFPPLLASLESIIDTMLRDLKENWCETLLRDMRVIIRQLHVIQYKNRLDE